MDRVTEGLNEGATGLDALSSVEIARRLHAGQVAALATVAGAVEEIAEAGARMAAALRGGGRLIYAAAGSSGLMAAADAMEIPGTFGIAPERLSILMAGGLPTGPEMPGGSEDDAAEADAAARVIAGNDAVIVASASGSTPYALAIAKTARARGATVIAMANNQDAALFDGADVCICLPTPPELVAGSTRMGAGTAQKAAFNMMSTVMAVALGHVHDGMMVNVRADNAKLRNRAAGIVSRIAGVPDASARAHLAAADGAVKTAVLTAAGDLSREEALALLEASQGCLRPALDRIEPKPGTGPAAE